MNNLFDQKLFSKSDEELVHGTARGNDLHYAEFMRRYMRAVYTFVRQHVGADNAEHITEQTFYTFWKSVHRLSNERKTRRWLFTIAKSLIQQSVFEKHLLPTRTLQVSLPRGYLLEVEKISLLEFADQLRSPLLTLQTWRENFRSWALPRIATVYQSVQNLIRTAPMQGRLRLKDRLSFNTYRV
jgi:hypothetical protein